MPKEPQKEPDVTPKTPRRRKNDPARDRTHAEDRSSVAAMPPPGAGLPEFGGPGAPAPGAEAEWELSLDEIGRRAYEIYENRGGEHGRDLDDWLAAEDELRRKRERKNT